LISSLSRVKRGETNAGLAATQQISEAFQEQVRNIRSK
jgi:hypothetical protein